MADPYLASSAGSSSAAGSSSDFVKKLFKMLEDPSYRHIVRWSDAGDSFIVLDTNEFTKSILPRHFKHSNFASFVRQLNKYDFHKVRTTDEGGACVYGESAWEFKHPDFQLHNKTQLDNIKRKTPAARRSQPTEESQSTEQIGRLESEIEYLKNNQALLTKHIENLTRNYENTLSSMITMQRSNETRDELMRSMLSHLENVSSQASTSQNRYPGTPDVDYNHTATSLMARAPEEFSMPLHQRSEANIDYLQELAKRVQAVSSSVSSQLYLQQQQLQKEARPGKLGEPASHSDATSTTGNDDVDNAMMGIDPAGSKLDYSRQSKSPSARSYTQNWAVPPKVLLVEDDATSRRVSGKFLQIFGCEADFAVDGLAAVSKMNMSKYDIVLMDIVMPNLDGVSASSLIRQFDPLTPIVAMTGNVSSNDVITYYSHGMNDVLAKPFTKEHVLEILEKHLIHLKMKDI